MKQIKIILLIFFIIGSLTGCQSVKDGMKGKKISEGEEFLVEKKNPPVVPPDFDDLPLPKNDNNSNNLEEEDDENLKKLFKSEIKKSSKSSDNLNTSTEQSLLKKIKTK